MTVMAKRIKEIEKAMKLKERMKWRDDLRSVLNAGYRTCKSLGYHAWDNSDPPRCIRCWSVMEDK